MLAAGGVLRDDGISGPAEPIFHRMWSIPIYPGHWPFAGSPTGVFTLFFPADPGLLPNYRRSRGPPCREEKGRPEPFRGNHSSRRGVGCRCGPLRTSLCCRKVENLTSSPPLPMIAGGRTRAIGKLHVFHHLDADMDCNGVLDHLVYRPLAGNTAQPDKRTYNGKKTGVVY